MKALRRQETTGNRRARRFRVPPDAYDFFRKRGFSVFTLTSQTAFSKKVDQLQLEKDCLERGKTSWPCFWRLLGIRRTHAVSLGLGWLLLPASILTLICDLSWRSTTYFSGMHGHPAFVLTPRAHTFGLCPDAGACLAFDVLALALRFVATV